MCRTILFDVLTNTCLYISLSFLPHSEATRDLAIKAVRNLATQVSSLAPQIEGFALKNLERLLGPPLSLSSSSAALVNTGSTDTLARRDSVASASGGAAGENLGLGRRESITDMLMETDAPGYVCVCVCVCGVFGFETRAYEGRQTGKREDWVCAIGLPGVQTSPPLAEA